MFNRSLSPRAAIALLVGSVILLCAVWALLFALEHSEAPEGLDPFQRARTTPAAVAAQYAGDRACTGCHPRIGEEHAASRHAATMRPMRRDRLPREFPGSHRFTDPETGLSYALVERKGRFALAAQTADGARSRPIDLVLGSGKTGMTFVSLEGAKAIRELRMSYFPHRRAWEITPGQRVPADPIGRVHEGVAAQRCLACHATRVSEMEVTPEERFMGVGCEGCHGPSAAHVAAARAGDPRRHVERLGAWSATRLNHLCGECHRSEKEIDPLDEVSLAQTQRFQPYGLMKSACFLKSGDRLSCLTCHNPHRDADRDPAVYERACRSCHASGATTCPVNPRDGCVRCHMPTREVTRGVTMADHWIRIFPRPSAGAAGGKD